MIQLTVALPIWNSRDIAWLAFEGLCNQKNIDFNWELLVAEEQIQEFGADQVGEFSERLKTVGCTSIRYFALDYRIPLPQKWKFLAEKTSKSSKVFLLHAADCYSEPLRLRRTFDHALAGYDWIQNRKGYYYSIYYKKTILFDQSLFGPGCLTGLNMAVSTSLLDRLPKDSYLDKGVDNWFFRTVAPKKVLWIEEEIQAGVDTDGLNNISLERRKHFNNPKPPFDTTNTKISDLIPPYVLDRLNKLSGR